MGKAVGRKRRSLRLWGLKSLPCPLCPAPAGLGRPGSQGDGCSAKPSPSRVGTDGQPPLLPEARAEAQKQGKPYFGAAQREEDAFLSATSEGEVKSVFSSSGQSWGIFISSLLALTLVNLLLKC